MVFLYSHFSQFYGLSEDFPRKNVFARSSEGKQRFLYIVTDLARRVLDYNDGRGVKVGEQEAPTQFQSASSKKLFSRLVTSRIFTALAYQLWGKDVFADRVGCQQMLVPHLPGRVGAVAAVHEEAGAALHGQ